jgi:hypothetical protein
MYKLLYFCITSFCGTTFQWMRRTTIGQLCCSSPFPSSLQCYGGWELGAKNVLGFNIWLCTWAKAGTQAVNVTGFRHHSRYTNASFRHHSRYTNARPQYQLHIEVALKRHISIWSSNLIPYYSIHPDSEWQTKWGINKSFSTLQISMIKVLFMKLSYGQLIFVFYEKLILV